MKQERLKMKAHDSWSRGIGISGLGVPDCTGVQEVINIPFLISYGLLGSEARLDA